MADAATPVVALFGPTAVGKTAVAIALADTLRRDGENPVAISADALQVYEGLGALTGAATPAEQERLEHRLIGFVPITERFSVGEYMRRAHTEIDAAIEAGRRPIVVGGTGLYLRAAIADLSLRKAAAGEESELWSPETRHPTLLVGLTMDRDALNERIDARTDAIVYAGAEAEVRRAEELGASSTARVALGFDELLAGDTEGLKKRSRNYARRQLTWMRKLPDKLVIDLTGSSPQSAALEIAERLRAG